jgi:EmrB/QacA subfamily drug resistance transporter
LSQSNEHDHQYEIHRIQSPALQMAIILAGVFMAVLDTSVVNVAIPKLETDLSASTGQIQWVLTGYMLVQGVVVPISGWLTDRLGAKKLFIFSLVVFTLGSALCGLAWNLDSMIAFRILQAAGGGFMMPVANAMIFRIFPPERRGAIMGIFGITIMAAPAFGPVLGGYLIQYSSWRWIFYINVPIGVATVLLAVPFLHEFPHSVSKKLDVLGFVFSTVGFFSMLFGFSNVSQHGWNSLWVYPFIYVGIALIILLVIQELMVPNPVIELRVFKSYMFTMSLLITSVIQVALFVGIFLLPLYLQNIRGYTALQTGLFLTPAALASAVMMPVSGKLFNKVGARLLGLIGLAIVTLSTFGFSHLTLNSTHGSIQFLYITRSVGMALTMMPIMTAGMNVLPAHLTNQGSGVGNTVRMVASSLGTALLTSYMTTQAKIHAFNLSAMVGPTTPAGIQLNQFASTLKSFGIPAYATHSTAVLKVYSWVESQAFVQGMGDTFLIATVLTLVAFILTMFYGSKEERAIRERKDESKGQPGSAAAVPAE